MARFIGHLMVRGSEGILIGNASRTNKFMNYFGNMRNGRLLTIALFFLLLTAISCTFIIVQWTKKSTKSSVAGSQPNSLTLNPVGINFGKLSPNTVAAKTITICNGSVERLIISHFAASCPCISIEPDSLDIAPNFAAEIVVRFDPSEEPNFRGKLTVRVEGKDFHNKESFGFNAAVIVSDDNHR
jgi:hypothetical protein